MAPSDGALALQIMVVNTDLDMDLDFVVRKGSTSIIVQTTNVIIFEYYLKYKIRF